MRVRRATAAPTGSSGWTRARGIVGGAVLVLLSAFAFLAIVLPFLLGAHTYTVLTGSMRPGMPPGSLVAVRETPVEDIRVGDVITYQVRSGEPTVVTHRVVGTTSSTGGERLLITRGDANDTDDPPVQAEQIRGRVVLALPWLGYPGILLGGQERGTLIAVVGIGVIGYGVLLLLTDLARSRRRRRALTALVALTVTAGALLAAPAPPALAAPAPTPPGLAAPTRLAAAAPAPPAVAAPAPLAAAVPPSSDHLELSIDGSTFSRGASFPVFDDLGPFVPGMTATVDLWIRNAGPDPAVAALRLDRGDGGPAFTASLALVVDGTPLAAGDEWRSRSLASGATLRVAVSLRMDASAANDTRRSRADAVPWVRLSGTVADDAHAGPTALPRTGIDAAPVAGLGLLALALTALGLALRRRGRVRDEAR